MFLREEYLFNSKYMNTRSRSWTLLLFLVLFFAFGFLLLLFGSYDFLYIFHRFCKVCVWFQMIPGHRWGLVNAMETLISCVCMHVHVCVCVFDILLRPLAVPSPRPGVRCVRRTIAHIALVHGTGSSCAWYASCAWSRTVLIQQGCVRAMLQ